MFITCNKCFMQFEFKEKEQQWFAEMGFEAPKKCKSCKKNQKTPKRDYTYRPSAKELELKEKMSKKKQKKNEVVKNVFDVLNEEEEVKVEKEVVKVIEVKKSWADMVEEEEETLAKTNKLNYLQAVMCQKKNRKEKKQKKIIKKLFFVKNQIKSCWDGDNEITNDIFFGFIDNKMIFNKFPKDNNEYILYESEIIIKD